MPYLDIADKVRFAQDPADKMVKAALCESDRLLFDVYCLLPGQAQKTHLHDDIDKIYLVQTGAPVVLLGEEGRVLSPGQAAYAPAGTPHGLRNDGPGPATVLVFQARGAVGTAALAGPGSAHK